MLKWSGYPSINHLIKPVPCRRCTDGVVNYHGYTKPVILQMTKTWQTSVFHATTLEVLEMRPITLIANIRFLIGYRTKIKKPLPKNEVKLKLLRARAECA